MSDETSGWDAIEEALAGLYGGVEPRHWGPSLPWSMGGPHPLDGVSAWPSTFGGAPHWHFVTYGLSELYAKETDDPGWSGYGFELTLRVRDPQRADEPPMWAVNLLQNLARYVFRSGNLFAAGHHLDLNGPIALERETALVAAAFTQDPQLGEITTPNGRLAFLQTVGLTADEYTAARSWDTLALLGVVAEHDPALLTDLDRPSWLSRGALRARVDAGVARDGSSSGTLYTSQGSVSTEGGRTVLGVGANALPELQLLAEHRLGHGRELWVRWPGGEVRLSPTPAEGTVVLDEADRAALTSVPAVRGDTALPSGLVLRVAPVEIRDASGQVIRTVG